MAWTGRGYLGIGPRLRELPTFFVRSNSNVFPAGPGLLIRVGARSGTYGDDPPLSDFLWHATIGSKSLEPHAELWGRGDLPEDLVTLIDTIRSVIDVEDVSTLPWRQIYDLTLRSLDDASPEFRRLMLEFADIVSRGGPT